LLFPSHIRLEISVAKALFLESIARHLVPWLPSIVLSITSLVFWSWLGHVVADRGYDLSHAVVFVACRWATIGLGFRSVDLALLKRPGRWVRARATLLARRPAIVPCLISFPGCLRLHPQL